MNNIKTVYENRIEYTNENGLLHRVDGPAIEWNNGDKSYFLNGMRHRTDGPAMVSHNGVFAWYLDGEVYSKKDFLKLTKTQYAVLGRGIQTVYYQGNSYEEALKHFKEQDRAFRVYKKDEDDQLWFVVKQKHYKENQNASDCVEDIVIDVCERINTFIDLSSHKESYGAQKILEDVISNLEKRV